MAKILPESFLRIALELVFINEMQVEGERLQVGRKNAVRR
jgi:hypothetical protein